jgi:hypothetical protein
MRCSPGTGFLLKNKDTLFDDLVELLQRSPAAIVRDHGWLDIPLARAQLIGPVPG